MQKSEDKHEVRNENGKLTYPKSDGEYSIQKPKGEFRRYIEWEGRWRHVYVVSTHYQQTLIGEPVKMVEFKLTKNSKTTYAAERSRFFEQKPRRPKETGGIA